MAQVEAATSAVDQRNTPTPDSPRGRVPRTLVVLLVIYFVFDVLEVVLGGSYFLLARTLIVGIATWRTLQGSRAASRFLAGMFILNVLFSLRAAAVLWQASLAEGVAVLLWALFLATIAAYILLSSSMRALYVSADKARWGRW